MHDSEGNNVKRIFGGIIAVLCALTVLFAITPTQKASADDEYYNIDGLWWGFEKATGTITWIPYAWEGSVIPSEIEGVKVVALGDGWVCYNNDEGKRDHLKEIVLPDGLKKIGEGAFSNCRIESIVIPDSVESIGDYAFRGCSELKEISMPGSLKEIGQSCFAGCIKLTRIRIPKNVNKIGAYAFRGCEDLEEVIFDGKESNITFGKNVFSECIWLHPDFSEPYRTSQYYRNRMDLKFSGDHVKDAIAIAASQEGYNEGRTFEDLDGMNRNYTKEYLKDYTEFNYYIGRPEWLWRPGLSEAWVYGGWCGQFCGWCLNMAGIPDEAHQYLNDEPDEEHVLWKDTVYAGGKYKVKPGDVLHMKEGHYSLVVTITEKKDSVVFGTWNGNWPGVVWHDFEYSKKDGRMVDRSWSGDDLTEILKFEPEVIEKLPHYTITFDANGGKTSKKSKDICEGAYFGVMPIPTREGYAFDGWYTEKTGGKKITAYRKARNTGDITLYARWIKESEKTDSTDQTDNDKENNEACANDAKPDVTVSSKTVKLSSLKNADMTVIIEKTGCNCSASFMNKTSGKLKKYVSVSKTGTVTIKKGAPKGTVKIKVTLKSVGGGETTVKTVKIKVK